MSSGASTIANASCTLSELSMSGTLPSKGDSAVLVADDPTAAKPISAVDAAATASGATLSEATTAVLDDAPLPSLGNTVRLLVCLAPLLDTPLSVDADAPDAAFLGSLSQSWMYFKVGSTAGSLDLRSTDETVSASTVSTTLNCNQPSQV
jgi:hypothetical protein